MQPSRGGHSWEKVPSPAATGIRDLKFGSRVRLPLVLTRQERSMNCANHSSGQPLSRNCRNLRQTTVQRVLEDVVRVVYWTRV